MFDAGLPAGEIPRVFLGFNLGVDVVQLAVIAIAGACFVTFRSALPVRWKNDRRIAAHVIDRKK